MLRGLKQRVFFAMQNYIKPEEIELTSGQLRAIEILAKKPKLKKKKLTLSQQKASYGCEREAAKDYYSTI